MKKILLLALSAGSLIAQQNIGALYCPDTSVIPNQINCLSSSVSLFSGNRLQINTLFVSNPYVVDGPSYVVRSNTTNTGPVQININSIGYVPVTKNGTTQLTAGDLVTDGFYIMTYDGSEMVISGGTGGGGGGGCSPGGVLGDVLFSNGSGGCSFNHNYLFFQEAVVGPTFFLGGGVNDCVFGGTWSGNPTIFQARISATGTPDTIDWEDNIGDSGTFGITGSAQALTGGVTLTCTTTTGHTISNEWYTTASSTPFLQSIFSIIPLPETDADFILYGLLGTGGVQLPIMEVNVGTSNVALGFGELGGGPTVPGSFNTLIGPEVAESAGTGIERNTLVGAFAGTSITGSNNIGIGDGVDPNTHYGCIIIGSSAEGTVTCTSNGMGQFGTATTNTVFPGTVGIGFIDPTLIPTPNTNSLLTVAGDGMVNSGNIVNRTANNGPGEYDCATSGGTLSSPTNSADSDEPCDFAYWWYYGSWQSATAFNIQLNDVTATAGLAEAYWYIPQVSYVTTFSNLSNYVLSSGAQVFCEDCTQTNPCAGSGSGAFALNINEVWQCGAGTTGGGGGGSPGGSDTDLQFNQAGSFGGSSAFVVDYTNGLMTIDPTTVSGTGTALTVNGDASGLYPAVSVNGQYFDTSGTGNQAIGANFSAVLDGPDVAGDLSVGITSEPENDGTGTAAKVIGVYVNVNKVSSTVDVYGVQVDSAPNFTGVTGVAAAYEVESGWPYGYFNNGTGWDQTGSTTFASLGTPTNNAAFIYCPDCTQTNPCAGSGSGAFALYINSTWECGAGALGSGVSGSGTTGTIPIWTSSSAVGNSSLTDNGTTVLTSEAISAGNGVSAGTPAYSGTPGTGGLAAYNEGTAPTAQATVDLLYADSTRHTIMGSTNNHAFAPVMLSNTGTVDPVCTASGDIGKVWFDTTTSTTAFKVCKSVSSSIGWSVVTTIP